MGLCVLSSILHIFFMFITVENIDARSVIFAYISCDISMTRARIFNESDESPVISWVELKVLTFNRVVISQKTYFEDGRSEGEIFAGTFSSILVEINIMKKTGFDF